MKSPSMKSEAVAVATLPARPRPQPLPQLTLAEPLERAAHDLSVEPLSGQAHQRTAIDTDDKVAIHHR